MLSDENLHVKSNFHQNHWMLQSKKVISAKISLLKSLSFCTDKAVSIKSTFLPENDLAIFKVRQAQSICSFILVFSENQLIYL